MRDTTERPREEGADARDSGSGPGRFAAGTPEDVAALYTWANIQGARYRDFSASRVRYREQVRARAAEALRDLSVAREEEDVAAHASTRVGDSPEWLREGVAPHAEASGPSAETQEGALGRDTSVVQLDRAEEEQVSREARRFREELEMRRRQAAARESRSSRILHESEETAKVELKESSGAARLAASSGGHNAKRFRESATVEAARHARESEGRGLRDSRGVPLTADPYAEGVRGPALMHAGAGEQSNGTAAEVWGGERWERVEEDWGLPPLKAVQRRSLASLATEREEADGRHGSGSPGRWDEPEGGMYDVESAAQDEYDPPAWLYGGEGRRPGSRGVPAARPRNRADGLEQPRIREERWSALRAVAQESGEVRRVQFGSTGAARAPLLIVFSLTGGVGKTTLVATLGRVLSAAGERVALGDTASPSLLPFYFGAREVRPGATRMFAPPEGSEDKPVLVANYELANYKVASYELASHELSRRLGDAGEQRQLVADLLRNGSGCNRTLLDLSPGAEWLVRRMATLGSTVLVPLLPDMNAVIGLDAVEQYFERMVDSDGRPMLPLYLLNQYDHTLTLHSDVRDVLRRRLGDRLLDCVIQRSSVISEALAEGMTAVDYAPESAVANDFAELAGWLRTVSPGVLRGMGNLRSVTR